MIKFIINVTSVTRAKQDNMVSVSLQSDALIMSYYNQQPALYKVKFHLNINMIRYVLPSLNVWSLHAKRYQSTDQPKH